MFQHPITLSKDIFAIAIAPITRLPGGTELRVVGDGFNDHTVRVQCNGSTYFVFLQDVEEPDSSSLRFVTPTSLPSSRSSLTTIPREIKAQENDIESMFRCLLRNSYGRQRQSDVQQRQEVAAWILMVMLGIISALALYILYLKTIGS